MIVPKIPNRLNKRFGKYNPFIFALLILLFAITLSAAKGLPSSKDKKDQLTSKPLILKISVAKKQCINSTAQLKAKIKNVSNHKVTIDKKGMLYRISFIRFRELSGSSLTTLGDAGPGYVGDYLVLEPGKAFKKTLPIVLKAKDKAENDIFQDPGKISMYIAYGQFYQQATSRYEGLFIGAIESNKLEIELVNCGNRRR